MAPPVALPLTPLCPHRPTTTCCAPMRRSSRPSGSPWTMWASGPWRRLGWGRTWARAPRDLWPPRRSPARDSSLHGTLFDTPWAAGVCGFVGSANEGFSRSRMSCCVAVAETLQSHGAHPSHRGRPAPAGFCPVTAVALRCHANFIVPRVSADTGNTAGPELPSGSGAREVRPRSMEPTEEGGDGPGRRGCSTQLPR